MLTKWSANFARPQRALLLSLTLLEFSKSGQIYSLHLLSLAVGQAQAFYRLPGQVFVARGYIRRATFSFVKHIRDTTHHVRGRVSVQELLDLGILIFQ